MTDVRYPVPRDDRQPGRPNVSRFYRVVPDAAPSSSPLLGVAIPGSTNQGNKVRAVTPPDQETVLFGSRGFVYYTSAPPIYKVVIQGGTNQGFTFEPVVQPDPTVARLGSRISYLKLPAAAVVIPPRLGIMVPGATNQGGVLRSIQQPPFPPGLASRPFYKLVATVPVVTDHNRTLMGVGI